MLRHLMIRLGRINSSVKTYYFDCDCGSFEHTLRFALDKSDTERCIYTEIYLNIWRPWWKRLWIATKYIFRHSCIYGNFDCWILKEADATRLRDMLDIFIRAGEKQQK